MRFEKTQCKKKRERHGQMGILQGCIRRIEDGERRIFNLKCFFFEKVSILQLLTESNYRN